jgi:hypothetical protein
VVFFPDANPFRLTAEMHVILDVRQDDILVSIVFLNRWTHSTYDRVYANLQAYVSELYLHRSNRLHNSDEYMTSLP